MPTNFEKLLAAERQGRMIATICLPRPGQEWIINAGNGTTNAPLFVLARWVDRFGAKVKMHVDEGIKLSPEEEIALESCRLLGLCNHSAGTPGLHPGHMMIKSGGCIRILESIPDADSVWRSKFNLKSGTPFVQTFSDSLPLYSVSDIRKIDIKSAKDYKVPTLCLMENAAVGVTQVACSLLEEVASSPDVLVVAGGGSNGGDGLAVARGLCTVGVNVKVGLMVDPKELKGDAAVNYSLLQYQKRCKIIHLADDPSPLVEFAENANLIVDAMLGTGIRGEMKPNFTKAVEIINASGTPVLAIDLPSGLHGDTGKASGPVIRARITVTLAAMKTGLLQNKGPKVAGRIYLANIGAPRAVFPDQN